MASFFLGTMMRLTVVLFFAALASALAPPVALSVALGLALAGTSSSGLASASSSSSALASALMASSPVPLLSSSSPASLSDPSLSLASSSPAPSSEDASLSPLPASALASASDLLSVVLASVALTSDALTVALTASSYRQGLCQLGIWPGGGKARQLQRNAGTLPVLPAIPTFHSPLTCTIFSSMTTYSTTASALSKRSTPP